MNLIESSILKKLLIYLFLFLLLVGSVFATQETLVGVQGKATYSNGTLIDSGDIQIKVTETDCASAFFTEDYPNNISKGYFNTLLGNLNPLSLDYNKDYYLCLYVNDQLQEPIQKFRGGQGQINNDDIAITEDYTFRNITSTDSITANYFYGDGSKLTGLPTGSGVQYGDYQFAEKNETNIFQENNIFQKDINAQGHIYLTENKTITLGIQTIKYDGLNFIFSDDIEAPTFRSDYYGGSAVMTYDSVNNWWEFNKNLRLQAEQGIYFGGGGPGQPPSVFIKHSPSEHRFEFNTDIYTNQSLLINATSCDSLDTDSNGLVYCGTDEGARIDQANTWAETQTISADKLLKLTANTTAIPCDETNTGSIMFSSDKKHYGCDGTNWNALY